MKYHSLVDSHVHCHYSDDCTVEPYKQVERAIELGLAGIALTDHYDIDYPGKRYHFEFDCAARRLHLQELRDRYKDKITLLHGIEIGLQPHVMAASRKLIQEGHFDLVICSTHVVDGFSLCSQSGFFEGKTQEQAYRRYLEEIYHTLCSFSDYDIVGHIGYIRRYGPYDNLAMPYSVYGDIIDMILKKVIADGKGIEINTSGYVYNLASPIPDLDMIIRYKHLGGEILTIGSDAHTIARVADHFEQAMMLVRRAGFKYVAHIKNRKPVLTLL